MSARSGPMFAEEVESFGESFELGRAMNERIYPASRALSMPGMWTHATPEIASPKTLSRSPAVLASCGPLANGYSTNTLDLNAVWRWG